MSSEEIKKTFSKNLKRFLEMNNKQPAETVSETKTYILNTESGKFHEPGCRTIKNTSQSKLKEMHTTYDKMIAQKYSPCGVCNP